MGLGLTFGNKNNISGRLKVEVKSQEVSDLDIALVDMNISNTLLVTVDMKLVDTFSILFIIYSILNELLQITTEIAFIIPGHQCFVSLADTYQQVLHKICSFEKDCINN